MLRRFPGAPLLRRAPLVIGSLLLAVVAMLASPLPAAPLPALGVCYSGSTSVSTSAAKAAAGCCA